MNDLPKTKRHRSPGGGIRDSQARKNCDLFIKLGYQATDREGGAGMNGFSQGWTGKRCNAMHLSSDLARLLKRTKIKI